VALGGSDPSGRAIAADALVPYLADLPTKVAADKSESEPAATRAATALATLADRLISDPDLGTKEHYARALSTTGQSSVGTSLNEVVRVNRISSLALGRAVGAWLASRLPDLLLQLKTDCDTLVDSEDPILLAAQNQQRNLLTQLKDKILRHEMPMESADLPRFDPLPVLTTPDVHLVLGLECRSVLQDRDEAKGFADKLLSPKERLKREVEVQDQTNASVVAASQNFAAASLTLAAILRRLQSGRPKDNLLTGAHLERIAIVNAPLDGLDLSGASLNGAFLLGFVLNFVCKACDLSYADFRYLELTQGANLEFSNVDGMILSYDKNYHIDMTGTNWWRATAVNTLDKTKQAPFDLESQYPRVVTEKLRKDKKLPD
jgi:hypothetical protein